MVSQTEFAGSGGRGQIMSVPTSEHSIFGGEGGTGADVEVKVLVELVLAVEVEELELGGPPGLPPARSRPPITIIGIRAITSNRFALIKLKLYHQLFSD